MHDELALRMVSSSDTYESSLQVSVTFFIQDCITHTTGRRIGSVRTMMIAGFVAVMTFSSFCREYSEVLHLNNMIHANVAVKTLY